jgi:immune inhibitor A
MRNRVYSGLALLILAALLAVPALAQIIVDDEDEYPTLEIIAEVTVPAADSVELAQRLHGAGSIAPPPVNPPPLVAGERQQLWVTNITGGSIFQVPATLQVVGEHVYLWVEDGANLARTDLERLATNFDRRVYPQTRDLWGSENTPGVDGDPRLHILFAHNLGAGTAAYFARRHTFPAEVFPGSNEREMFFVNLDVFGTGIATPAMESTLAHEFQHMIRAHINPNEDTWLNEGFSTFTELYLGYDTTGGIARAFLNEPWTQLNTFGESGTPRAADYGAGLLFVTYFFERYGLDALRALSADPATGLTAVDNTLRGLGEPGVDELFADWVLANWLHDRELADGRYGYRLISPHRAAARLTATQYPLLVERDVPQYATDYFELVNLGGADRLEIELAMPAETRLIPADAYSGAWMWYSNRGDVSNTTLTRAFDLADAEAATLRYQVWHEIERNWDYAYVTLSADGGETWVILPAGGKTEANPYGNAYGPGYTGDSGGWIEEVIALDDYTGGEVLLRFKLVSDDAVNLSGLAIDDVAIPEIGYFSDFEDDDGGWEPAGWLWTDNRLPQQVWVQAAQIAGGGTTITRWLAPADGTTWTLPLESDVERVMLAVSPFAPITTVPMPYTLTVTTR